MVTSKEQDADRFANRYREEHVERRPTIKRHVIGGDWGANGYTTIEQADDLAIGSNWAAVTCCSMSAPAAAAPGLYLAATTGCSVVLADVPLEGLAVAAARVRAERLEETAWLVNASAHNIPFRAAHVDAIVHTDVLC